MPYNSDNFNLNNWKITLPVDSKGGKSGTAVEVENLVRYENSNYFWDANDKAMVFRASADGATTSGSKYARSELREMNGDDRAAWKLSQGGTMTATVKVDQLPSWKDGSAGRMVIGQIHGEDHELVRLYYEDGSVHFVNDRAGSGNKETTFSLKNAKGQEPSIGIGEKFSYMIDAHGKTLTVKVFADGQEYSSTSSINSVWQSDKLYFKAGVYLGINESNGKGSGQASFYALDFSHARGDGMEGWKKGLTSKSSAIAKPAENDQGSDSDDHSSEKPHTTPSTDTETASGNTKSNVLTGGDGDDVIQGREGNDVLKGGGGNDYLLGNEGNDTLIGGSGADTLKGGNGADTYVVMKQGQIVNVVDFSVPNGDRVDVTEVLGSVFGFKKNLAFDEGYLQMRQIGKDVGVYADLDGKEGSGKADLIAMLNDAVASNIGAESFVLPEDSKSTSAQPDINGTSASNVLTGTNQGEIMRGLGGNDVIRGESGNDILMGNEGNDTITGGTGADTIRGGDGKDTYVFQTLKEAGDVIQDFEKGEKLDISGIVDDHSKMQDASASQLVQKGFLTFEEQSTHVDVYVDTDGSSGPTNEVLLTDIATSSEHEIDSSIILL